jgi:hypothetical protein
MLVFQIAACIALVGLVLLALSFALPWLVDQLIRGLPGIAVVVFGSVLVALLVADPNNGEATLVIGATGVVIGLVAWWSHKAAVKRSALSECGRSAVENTEKLDGLPRDD